MTDPSTGSTADESPGLGWWKASDGRWYPPQQTNEQVQRPQRGFLKSGLIVLAAFIAIIALLVFVIAFLGAPADEREEGRRGATTERVTESGLEFG